jgi:radical SAM superfamily enzyme YgiQ (UPF0313 family)
MGDISFDHQPFGAIGVVNGSRGCPFRCIFCPKCMVPSQARFHSPETVIRYAERLVHREGCGALFFADLTFTLKPSWVLEVTKGLERLGAPYVAQTRTDCVTPEIAAALAASGCYRLDLGIESGDDGILRALQKDTNWEQAASAVRLCREAGIHVVGAFHAYFAPGETGDSIRRTRDRLRKLGANWSPSIWTPFPGSPLWDQGVQEGRIGAGGIDWSEIVTTAGTIGTGFTREEVHEICLSMERKYRRRDVTDLVAYWQQHGLANTVRRAVQHLGRVA